MINFYVLSSDGAVLRSGVCQVSMLNDQAIQSNGEKAYKGIKSENDIMWETPVKSDWEDITEIRNELLSACDWTQMPDVPVATQQLWQPYRQALRDITKQTDPANIIFPTPPV